MDKVIIQKLTNEKIKEMKMNGQYGKKKSQSLIGNIPLMRNALL